MKIALIGRFEEGEVVAGPERVARELLFELKKLNPETVFIEYFFSGYANSTIFKKLIGKEFVQENSIIRLGIFPLIIFLVKEKFEIIHIINLQRFIFILFLLKPFLKSKITATLHGFLRFEVPQKNFWIKRYFIDLWVEKLIIKKCQLLVFPSQLIFETFKKHYHVLEKKYKIIPNGVGKIFKVQNRSFPTIKNSLRIIFYTSSIDASKKGLEELIESLNNAKYKIELFVIGEEGKAISSVNLEIVFAGKMSHQTLVKFLSDKHFVIKSGVFDTFSIFIAECMTMGIIPIINENVGIKDYIENKVNGFVYNKSSSTDLPKLLEEIFEMKYDLEVISAKAKKISEELNWEIIAKKYYTSFQSLIK